VRLGKGESALLSGGETVSENQDGSLIVSARSATGGTIATTLRANGAGVDVTTHAHEIAVGGDAIEHADPAAPVRHTARAHAHARARHEPAVVQRLDRRADLREVALGIDVQLVINKSAIRELRAALDGR
jgi:hypothetical protein